VVAVIVSDLSERLETVDMVYCVETFSAGKDPTGLAATIHYLSCLKTGENITQDNISNAGGVTGVTIRNRLKDLRINQLQ
jgi:transcription initiation factor TFIIIB Brf1 subunit/transcription initiation factor TFIIB